MGSLDGKPAGAGLPRRAAAARSESGVPTLRLFTRREVAAAFGVSPLRVTKWTAAGMPVADRGGAGKESRYDLAAVVTWRIETEVQRRMLRPPGLPDPRTDQPPAVGAPRPAAPPRPRRFARSTWMGR